MATKVYTPGEIAQILHLTEEEVQLLVTNGEVKAFPVLGHMRITEEALLELMNRPYLNTSISKTGTPPLEALVRRQQTMRRRRNPDLEKSGRDWALGKVKGNVANLVVHSRKSFMADSKQGVLAISTTTSGPSSPSEKHGWRVLGGMMGPVQ